MLERGRESEGAEYTLHADDVSVNILHCVHCARCCHAQMGAFSLEAHFRAHRYIASIRQNTFTVHTKGDYFTLKEEQSRGDDQFFLF
jgi:hypothetical protein